MKSNAKTQKGTVHDNADMDRDIISSNLNSSSTCQTREERRRRPCQPRGKDVQRACRQFSDSHLTCEAKIPCKRCSRLGKSCEEQGKLKSTAQEMTSSEKPANTQRERSLPGEQQRPMMNREPEPTAQSDTALLPSRLEAQNYIIHMALTKENLASRALHRAMLCVVPTISCHRALELQAEAIQALRAGIQRLSGTPRLETSNACIAACMFLAWYDALDPEPDQWKIHLDGAAAIVKLHQELSHERLSDVLVTWYSYHQVLACFSLSTPSRDEEVLSVLRTFRGDKTIIPAFAHCSLRLLEVIQLVTCIRKKLTESRPLQCAALLVHCDNIVQNVDPRDSIMTEDQRQVIIDTAELWKVASLLYLLRALPCASGSDTSRLTRLERAGKLLKSRELDFRFCLWPLFVIGCELHEQCSRDTICELLNKSPLKGASRIQKLLSHIWEGDPEDWINLSTAKMIYPWFIEGPTDLGLFDRGFEHRCCNDE